MCASHRLTHPSAHRIFSIFLFLFTGLLLQTNPDGITNNRLLFAVLVGALTTSIVAFTFYLFVRYGLLRASCELACG